MEVRVRGGFSDRNKIKEEAKEIQLYDFDRETRIRILNQINKILVDIENKAYYDEFDINQYFNLYRFIVNDIFCEEVIEPVNTQIINNNIRTVILDNSYDDVLTFIEAFTLYCKKIKK